MDCGGVSARGGNSRSWWPLPEGPALSAESETVAQSANTYKAGLSSPMKLEEYGVESWNAETASRTTFF